MLTCNELNNLTTPILYGENMFYFPEPFNDLAVFLLQLRPTSFHAIRNVKIQLDSTFPTEGLDILCASNSLTTLQLASTTPISISKKKSKGVVVLPSSNTRSAGMAAAIWRIFGNALLGIVFTLNGSRNVNKR